jgi:hypothetical protein
MTSCPDCQQYQHELARLRAENKHLLRLLQRAYKVIKKQKVQLDEVRAVSWHWICRARKALSIHQPRGTWSLWKGRLEVASEIFSIVWIDWASALLNAIGIRQ